MLLDGKSQKVAVQAVPATFAPCRLSASSAFKLATATARGPSPDLPGTRTVAGPRGHYGGKGLPKGQLAKAAFEKHR